MGKYPVLGLQTTNLIPPPQYCGIVLKTPEYSDVFGLIKELRRPQSTPLG